MAELRPAPEGYPIKLVRDRTQTIVNETREPGDLFYGPMPEGADRSEWLRKKLVEEVAEYVVGGEVAELADVQAVIDALVVEHGVSTGFRDLVNNDLRGGFFNGVMMYGYHPEFDGKR